VLVGAEPAAGLSAREFARRVALLAQNRPAPGGLSVRDVVTFGRHPYRGRWRAADPQGTASIEWALEVTGTASMADRTVGELSGGEAQRVWLATALAQRTDVLLLDEPTKHLDLRFQVEILDLVRSLADQHGVAVGVVLHDLNQAAAVADEVVLLHGGSVRGAGRPVDVLSSAVLTDVYGIRVDVSHDSTTGEVFTRPVGAHTQRLRQLA
jgi:iron complex transport system ATP-binding protein